MGVERVAKLHSPCALPTVMLIADDLSTMTVGGRCSSLKAGRCDRRAREVVVSGGLVLAGIGSCWSAEEVDVGDVEGCGCM